MGKKTTAAYEAVFRFTQSKLDSLNVRSITSDFEIAIGLAATKVYNGITVRKCYFHYSQVCLL